MALSAGEKIDKIITSGWPLAWEGCHKIYFLEDDERKADAERIGYSIYPAKDLPKLILDSCSLVFVSRWGYDNDDFDHECNIPQFDEGIYEAAQSRLP